MKNILLTFFLFLGVLFFQTSFAFFDKELIVSKEATCEEYIIEDAKLTINDWPKKARGKSINAFVILSYNLDGSGKPQNITLIDSQPNNIFNRTTKNLLKRTLFKKGVEATDCIYIKTYGSVKRAEKTKLHTL